MNRLSVIIPSKNAANLVPCVRAVRQHDPKVRIIVVNDGLDLDIISHSHGDDCWCCRNDPLQLIAGVQPFIFARNCNLGIRAAGEDDIVLLNDDALLTSESADGLAVLQSVGAANPAYGIIGAATNITGQPLQTPHGRGLREVPYIAFVCALIPRRTIHQIGMLDERYSLDYGCEDRDYCEACRRAALKVGVYDWCYVDHGSLTSTYRGDPRASKSFARNQALYEAKWG